jgi:NAD(P)-dependent dehydrogenase (short-subunit alcohol dehydrogenase family)
VPLNIRIKAVQNNLCVITGATSGIGLAAAEALARQGARLALVGRDAGRGEAALGLLRSRVPGVRAALHLADLARLAEVRRLGRELAATYARIDVLVNNAGALFQRRSLTEDGIERTFALNHIAYFVLTQELRERLLASPAGRVVNVASRAHVGAALDFANLNLERGYSGWIAYRRSKLANILFTRELARRLAGTGVSANCLHPGFVASRFGDNNRGLFRWGFGLAKRFSARSPEKGAETVVYLAAAPEVQGTTGAYFADLMPATASRAARDDATARLLWEASERLSGAGHSVTAP